MEYWSRTISRIKGSTTMRTHPGIGLIIRIRFSFGILKKFCKN
jgi:hypothetical protein